MNLLQQVQQPFRAALSQFVDDPEPYVAMVRAAQDPRFGDYQANGAMPLAKVLSKQPRAVAQEIVDRLPLGDLLEKPEIAGPGFINVRLRADWIATQIQRMAGDERLGVEPANPPRTYVVDYSSANVAKPMHVGHLRSTIIGDALARLLRFLGHHVITDNHLGDWGTQFGMLLYGYKHFRNDEALRAEPVQEMVRLYKEVRRLIDPAEKEEDDKPVACAAEELARSREALRAVREETAKLQAGDPTNLELWREFKALSLKEFDRIYRRLDVQFDYTLGESDYNPMLPAVVQGLEELGIAQPSAGAVVVFIGEGESPQVAIVRKRDGAFTYTTTDLATIRYRVENWHPDAILYVVGTPQALHFRNLFDIARRWGYDRVALEHIAFGSVLGPDKKMLRTRTGENVPLESLLDEALTEGGRRYFSTRDERQARGEDVPDLSDEERRQIAEVVGLGAVKYADLSQNRTSDYVFSWDKMLSTEGNTATYMQYAYVRCQGIFRKENIDVRPLRAALPLPVWEKPEERALAVQLLRFGDALDMAAADYKPNAITSYLWDLAKAYSGFFTNCPVLKAPTPELRQSRLLLCDLTARVIQKGLELLGIRTVERM
jgi:arginyl-tRNA synthetase